jgi:hypothetical protein
VGVLRGPDDALAAGGANSADMASLLREMIRAKDANRSVRFVIGQASEGMMVLKHISIPMVKHCMQFVACLNKAVAGGREMNESAAECLSDSIEDTVKECLDEAIDEFAIDPLGEGDEGTPEDIKKRGVQYAKLLKKAKAAAAKLGSAPQPFDATNKIPGLKDGKTLPPPAARSATQWACESICS